MNTHAHRLAGLLAGIALGGLTLLGPATATAAVPTSPVPLPVDLACPWSNVILGTPQDDYLVGTEDNDLIIGFGGHDILEGMGGRDTLVGGADGDLLVGGPAADCLLGGGGADVAGRYSYLAPGPTDDENSVEGTVDLLQNPGDLA